MNFEQQETGMNKGERDRANEAPSVTGDQAGSGRYPVIVAGIGASESGLSSLKQLFDTMPAGHGVAFVIILHMTSGHENQTIELLREQTAFAVVEATDGMEVVPDRIHVVPPDKFLNISGSRLTFQEPVLCNGLRMPIDHFLCSLASDQGSRSCGILLSGGGGSGTLGLSEIRAAGGRTFVEDPDCAERSEMVQNAIDAGVVDAVLSPDGLAEAILGLAEGVMGETRNEPAEPPAFDADLRAILDILRIHVGHDFRCYKPGTLVRRVRRRMALKKVATLSDYSRLLKEHPDEIPLLYKDLLIGVTEFFRQPQAWDVLGEKVIDALVKRAQPRSEIRVWVPGCATGKEVYSLAMLLSEKMETSGKDLSMQIFATDSDEDALATARRGSYLEEDLGSNLSPERLNRFFTNRDGRYQVIKEIRQNIVFAPQNLTVDPPFSRLDLITCRNLLIYLDQTVQKKVITLFHFALREEGFLFLGNAETIGTRADLFEPVSKKWRIYRRIGVGRRVAVEIPLLPSTTEPLPIAGTFPVGAIAPRMSLASTAQQMLVERFAPACVMIDRKLQVLYVHGDVEGYLTFPSGELTTKVVDMAREGLQARLRGAINRCMEGNRSVSVTARVRRGKKSVPVKAVVSPLRHPREAAGLLLVTFEDYRVQASKFRRRSDGEGDVRQLQDELKIIREELQSTIEQLESSNDQLKASNEEVTAANEELQSANEELETSKEELQSLNEELNTVNGRLQEKVEELESANNDLMNLLSSTHIATMFLDKDLKVKRYTPAITRLFGLIPSDAGRPAATILRRFTDEPLFDDAAQVLGDLTSIAREVQADDGSWYIRRITPYRTQDDRIEGVVVTFMEFTERKRAEEALREAHDRAGWLARFPEENPNPVLRVSAEGTVLYSNPTAARLPGWECSVDGLMPRALLPLVGKARAEAQAIEEDMVLGGTPYAVAVAPIPAEHYANIYGRDITERKRVEEALRESEQRVRRKLESILSPEGDIAGLDLSDIIDSPAIQSLMDDFYKLAPIPMSILDLQGKLLVGVGWQDICMQFHRAHPETCKHCVESDTQLTADVPPGEFKLYKCKNNMWDIATPILVGGHHVGNLFSGQFLFDDEVLDYDFFRSQAKQFGFDEEAYIAALESVPRLSRESVNRGMSFFVKLADMLSKLSYSNIKLARSLGERDGLMDSLRESELRLSRAQEIAHLGSWELDLVKNELTWSDEVYRIFGLGPQEFGATYEAFLEFVHPEDRAAVDEAYSVSVREGQDTYEIEHRVVRKDTGEIRWVHEKCQHVRDETGRITRSLGMVLDITERKRAEEHLKVSLGEKEVLLKEIHHRVKNNMQVISSLVSLQAEGSEDEAVRGLLRDVTDRVRSMALVHEKLYQSADLARVDFAEYARSLLNYLWRAHDASGSGIRLALDLEPVSLAVDVAVPCGLILNELAGNALKHAFQGRSEGQVIVSLRRSEAGQVRLGVRDNGAGLPPGMEWRQTRSLGLRLVQMLTGQLGCEVQVQAGEGTAFEIVFGGQQNPS
jgi:PAS domain S-box-containing protein